jgi:hypothetical protein
MFSVECDAGLLCLMLFHYSLARSGILAKQGDLIEIPDPKRVAPSCGSVDLDRALRHAPALCALHWVRFGFMRFSSAIDAAERVRPKGVVDGSLDYRRDVYDPSSTREDLAEVSVDTFASSP